MKNASRLILFIVCLSFLLFSFKKKDNQELLNDFKIMANKRKKFNQNKLHFDGVYTLGWYDVPFCFYENGVAFDLTYNFVDSENLSEHLKGINALCVDEKYRLGGVFDIHNDTLDVICYSPFYGIGDRLKSHLAHFQGIVKNADTIIDFGMVPPYPKIKWKFNPGAKTVKYTLVFKSLPAKALVDSAHFWVNKYIN